MMGRSYFCKSQRDIIIIIIIIIYGMGKWSVILIIEFQDKI